MRPLGIVLSDAATVSEDGKFSILGGGVDRLGGGSFPLVHPALTVVLRIVLDDQDMGASFHDFEVTFEGPAPVVPTGAKSPFPTFRNESFREVPPYVTIVCNFNPVRFERPGIYWVVAKIDGKELERSALAVQLIRLPAEPEPTLQKGG